MAFWCPRTSSLQPASSKTADFRCNSPHPSHHRPAAAVAESDDRVCGRGGTQTSHTTTTTTEERARWMSCWMVDSWTSSAGRLRGPCLTGRRTRGWCSGSGSRPHCHCKDHFRWACWQEPECSTSWGSERQRMVGRECRWRDSDLRLQEAGWAKEWVWSCSYQSHHRKQAWCFARGWRTSYKRAPSSSC